MSELNMNAYIKPQYTSSQGFPGGTVVKNPPANAGDAQNAGLIPGSGRSPAEGYGNPLQYSCLENPMDRGARWVTVHRVTKSWTQLSTSTHVVNIHIHVNEYIYVLVRTHY